MFLQAVNKAAKGVHLSVLKWIYTVQGGHLDVVAWLHEYPNKGFTLEAPYWASRNGYFRGFRHTTLKYLMHPSGPYSAARNEQLEIVQGLNENNCGGFTKDAMSNAAENGHMSSSKLSRG
ncbi:hypothetical protein PHMEG_00018468 [Phytophthora megakarya]|uniref:Uncharacterized protein n=1 Tax=Phytophthora megakarya TaxID=4795 RepID=A0A225VU09_9STRA|nr:hypothetical protein PHMEG_00018468 [Phytophthora megakarya]